MSNRYPVTIRLNLTEQGNMRSLRQFWSLSEREIMKLAFEQLVTSTAQLQRNLEAKEKANGSQEDDASSSAGSADTGGQPTHTQSAVDAIQATEPTSSSATAPA